MISLDKCTERCNVWSPKIWVPKEAKDINVKAFNVKTNTNEAKTTTKHISWYDCKRNVNSATCNSNQKWNNKPGEYEWINYHKCKKWLWLEF